MRWSWARTARSLVELAPGVPFQALQVGLQVDRLHPHQDLDGEGEAVEEGPEGGDQGLLLVRPAQLEVQAGDLQDGPPAPPAEVHGVPGDRLQADEGALHGPGRTPARGGARRQGGGGPASPAPPAGPPDGPPGRRWRSAGRSRPTPPARAPASGRRPARPRRRRRPGPGPGAGGRELGPPAPQPDGPGEADQHVGHLARGEAQEQPVLDVQVRRDLVPSAPGSGGPAGGGTASRRPVRGAGAGRGGAGATVRAGRGGGGRRGGRR